jgi:hypothetical protein
VWHYGHGFESSSLVVKIPDGRATFVILANSDGLSRWRGLGDGADITASPAATLFLNWYRARTPAVGRVSERFIKAFEPSALVRERRGSTPSIGPTLSGVRPVHFM